jgi:hypothetical protein
MGKKIPAIDRFLLRVEKTDKCWDWAKYLNRDGYGVFCLAKAVNITAHRFSYQYYKGVIPEGMEIDHICSNRKCVNPDHLELATHLENVRRGVARGGYKNNGKHLINYQKDKTHCLHGHEYRGDNLIVDKWSGGRRCKICEKAKFKRYQDKQKEKRKVW